jgi:hypothetical protein
MAEAKVHRMERTIRVPQVGEPYWQTVCGIRLAHTTENVTTAEDRKQVTCTKCQKGGK